jgi:hypothetical protein
MYRQGASRRISLAETVVLPESADSVTQAHAERLAWGVVLIAFSAFCVLFLAASVGLHYFLFRMPVPMQMTLLVGRGIVGVRDVGDVEQSERGSRELSRGMTITTDRTDSLSQAAVTLRDQGQDNRLVATITLKSDTTLRLRHALRPQFDWTDTIYQVELVDFSGELDITISDDLQRDIEVNIRTTGGAWIRLGSPGRYNASASTAQARVTNRRGEAVIIAPDEITARSVPEGKRGVLELGSSSITFVPALTDLLTNSSLLTFTPADAPADSHDVPQIPIGWSCTFARSLPRGHFGSEFAPDGRLSFRMVRTGDISANGEVRCEQRLGTPQAGLDVTGYDRLSIRTTLYVNYQSLNVCGFEASECPLMLLIDYVDVNGVERQWYRGIYARLDPGSTARLSCDSCIQEHVHIYEKTWYTFDSGNLLDDAIPPDQRPAAITDVVFYASGHQYDVYVDEVALLAGTTSVNVADDTGINGADNQNGG